MIRPVLMLLLGLLMGCPETPEPEPPSSPAPVGDTPPAAEDRLICAAETLESAVTSPTRPVRVVIHDGSRGALAWVRDDSLHVGSFTGSAVAPHSESQPMVADTELDLVARMSTGTLIVSKGPCVSEGESRRCLYGQFFDDGPEPASTVARVALAGAPTSRRRVRTDTGVYIAHAFRENTLSVTTFEPTPEGEVHTRQQPLGTEVEAALSPVEVLGMAAHEDRWAVFWRFGAPELPQSQVVLSLPDQEHPSRQLKHALSLDTVLWRGF